GAPVLGVKEAHRPFGGGAPAGRLALLVPDLDLPKGGVAAAKRLAAVLDLGRFGRLEDSAVPEVAGGGREPGLAGCNQNSVRGLPQAAGFRVDGGQEPTQTWFRRVDPGGVDSIFAAQLLRAN